MKTLIKKPIHENQTVLFVIKSSDYNWFIKKIARLVSKDPTTYVTINKTYESLKESFNKKDISTENFIFIDAISKTITSVPKQTDMAYYVSSPGAFTELSLIITKFLKHNFDYLVFDSITNLMTYQKPQVIHKFLSSLSNKIKETDTKGIFIAIDVKEQESLIKQCSLFFDKTIYVKK